MQIPEAIQRELRRYHRRVTSGRWKWHLGTPGIKDTAKLPILIEEIGEIGTALARRDEENLKEELAQVAALALSWLLAKEEETGPTRERTKGR